MEISKESKGFMVRNWEELRKGGGIAFSENEIIDFLEGGGEVMFSRDELIEKVVGYFNSCTKRAVDADTGEVVVTWVRNPTKSGLALTLGIDKQTLIDYVNGVNGSGKAFSIERPDSKRMVATQDFDVLRKAYSIIEVFYEEKLADNRNPAGVIYWLNNSANTRWSNDQTFSFEFDRVDKKALSIEDLPKLSEMKRATIGNVGDIFPKVKEEE